MTAGRDLTVALVLTQSPGHGGGFTYERAFVEALARHPLAGVKWVLVVVDAPVDPSVGRLPFPVIHVAVGWRERIHYHAAAFTALDLEERLRRHLPTAFARTLARQQVDLVWFLCPMRLATLLTEMPFVMTVWDLCHRDWPEFPEVGHGRNFEAREELMHRLLPKAIAVIAESEAGREALIRRYGLDAPRVRILPFVAEDLPAGRTAAPSSRPPFLFYPAQYWPHKNHLFLLTALAAMRAAGREVGLVCCGSDKGNLAHLKQQAQQLGVADLVTFHGFVSREELAGFYRTATALAMPTFFGPTNLPPLEAWGVGCPVLYPDLPGLRDQVAGAGWLIDLGDPGSVGRRLAEMAGDPQERERRLAEGRRRHAAATPDRLMAEVGRIVAGYAELRRRWR